MILKREYLLFGRMSVNKGEGKIESETQNYLALNVVTDSSKYP